MKKDNEPVYMPHELEEKPKRVVCNICYGMGVREIGNGDTIDCPNRSCDNGFILIKK